jgi:hypothetical protein
VTLAKLRAAWPFHPFLLYSTYYSRRKCRLNPTQTLPQNQIDAYLVSPHLKNGYPNKKISFCAKAFFFGEPSQPNIRLSEVRCEF